MNITVCNQPAIIVAARGYSFSYKAVVGFRLRSTNPEVHNVLQRRQKGTETWLLVCGLV